MELSVGPGQWYPAWSGSLHFGSWLSPSEEVILVQEPGRGQGVAWERRHGVCWVLGRMVQGKGRSPDQHSQRLSEQGLPCLKSGGPEGKLLAVSPALPSTFSLEALECLSESLILLTSGVGDAISDLKVNKRMAMGI